MTTAAAPVRNGIDTAQVYGTLDALKAAARAGPLRSSASHNRWIERHAQPLDDPGLLRAPAARTPRARRRSRSTPASRAILLGTDNEAPNPAEYLLHALAGCLTTDDRLRRRRAQGAADARSVDARGRPRRPRRARPRRRPPQRLRAHPRRVPRSRATPRARSSRRSSSGPRRARSSTTWSPTACRSPSTSASRVGAAAVFHELQRTDRRRRASWSRWPSASPPTSRRGAGGARPRRQLPVREHRRAAASRLPRRAGAARSSAGSASAPSTTSSSPRAGWPGATRRVAIGVNMHLVVVLQLVRAAGRWRVAAGQRAPRAGAFGGSLRGDRRGTTS